MDELFKGLTSTIGNAAQGVGNFFNQQFTPAVQRFTQQAGNELQQLPGQVEHAVQQLPSELGQQAQYAMQGKNVFGQQQPFSANNPLAPAPKITVADNIGNWANQAAGGGLEGWAAGLGASALPGIAQGFFNIPEQVQQATGDTINAFQHGTPLVKFDPSNPIGIGMGGFNLTPQGLGIASEWAQPALTIATAGHAPELLDSVKNNGWGMAALKGLLNGSMYGGAYGGLQGLQENKDAATTQEQFTKTLPYIGQGMLAGGTLGTVLGPTGKLFFGNKQPGQTATLAQNGLVPPEAMGDAYRILGIKPEASLDEVRSAYSQALQEFHPQNGGTPEAVDVLNNAYEMVTRNNAPAVSFTNGQPQIQFSDEFGGNTLTQKQIAEARRAAADNTAFQARMANLKAGNVPIKSARPGEISTDQFLQHGADLLTPEGQQALVGKVNQAAANQPAFQDLLSDIGQQTNGRALSNLKTPESIAQKIVEKRANGEADYGLGSVQDSLRGTIIVNSEKDVDAAAAALKNELQNRGWQRQGEGLDYFKNPQPSGYQGYHLNIGMPDGTIGEVQIHTPQSFANAKLTHGVYDSFGENLPTDAKTRIQALRAKINTDPVANLDAAVRQQEMQNPPNVLSPMEADFRNAKQPLTQAGQIAQRLNEANPDVQYKQLNNKEKNAQIVQGNKNAADQRAQTAVDQTRVKLGQPSTEQAIGDQAAQQAKAFAEATAQQQKVTNLLKVRETLQARIDAGLPETNPDIDHLLKSKDQLQQQADQAAAFIRQNKNNPEVGQTIATPKEIRAHIKELQASMKNIDDQVKTMRVSLKAKNGEISEGLKTQIKSLNDQIAQEQGKARLKTTIAQAMQQPNDFGNRGTIRDIVNRPAPEQPEPAISNQEAQAPIQQATSQSPAQQAFAQTKVDQQTAPETAQGKPQPAGAPKTNGVFTFSPAEGGAAKTGTPSELGLTQSSKTSNVWEDKDGNQYVANYNPEVERSYKKQAGLPTLRTPEEVMQETNGKIRIEPSKNRNALQNAVNYGGVPMDLTLSRSPNTNARIAGMGILDAQNHESYLSNRWKTMLENSSKGLSADEIANATKVVEGLEKPMSDGAAQYAKTIKAVTNEADLLAKKAGVMTRNEDGSQQAYQSMPDYFPRVYTKAQYDAMAEQARTPQEALDFKRKGQLYTNRFGNMEQHRGQGMENIEQRRDAQVMQEYADHAAHKIATTSVFGANSEKAATLIQNLINDGNMADADTFKKALELNGIAQGPNDTVDPTEKLMSNAMQTVRAGIDFTNLGGVTGVHHLTVEPGLIGQYGMKNTLRALPEFGRAFIGQPSDLARENVSRLHNTPTTGVVGSAMDKFYKTIQLDRVLNAFSAQTAKAADLTVSDMEKNLSDPTVRTNILQAHLPYDDIAQRGYFTPEERHAYIQAGLKNNGLLFNPDGIAKIATNPLGKAIMALSGPLTARTQRLIPSLFHQIQDNGNFSPAVKWGLSALLLGTVSRMASNIIQNHPQGTPQQLLTEGALSGMGVNYGPVSTTGAANMIQYPEYAGSTAAGMLGGPLASMGVNTYDAIQNIHSDKPADQNTGLRELTRYIPIAGPTIANSAFPAKSWVGNRPSDIVGTLLKGNQPQQQQGMTVQHSPLDLLRANPQVADQQAKLSAMYGQQNAAIGKLDKTGQANYITMKNAFATGDYQTGYKLMAQDPKLYDARAAVEQASAKTNGLSVNPLYDSANKDSALAFIKFQGMSADQQVNYLRKDTGPITMERQIDQYKSDPGVQAQDKQIAAANGTNYTPYTPNPLFATNTQTGKPLFSDQQVAAYRVYEKMPATGTQKVEWLGNHPEIMGAQLASQQYELQKLQTEWDNRPQGQSLGDFAATHTTSLFGGIDQNGKVIPAYNLFEEPKYQIYMRDPEKGAVIAAYNAFVANKNYTSADALAAQNSSWFPLYQQANKAYKQTHPYNSETASELGGAGIDFGGTGGSGSSGSSGGSMKNYLKKQEMYAVLHDTVPKTPILSLTKPLGVANKLGVNPFAHFAAAQQQSLAKILNSMPKLEAAPQLKGPVVKQVENKFKLSPVVPSYDNERVQAGRVSTKLQ